MDVACHGARHSNFWTATSCWKLPFYCHRSTRPCTAYLRQGCPCPVVSHPPSSCTCKSLPVDHLISRDRYRGDVTKITCPDLSGSAATPKACVNRRRPRLRQPVAALTYAPRSKTQCFLFFLPCLVRAQQSCPSSFSPARPHCCLLPSHGPNPCPERETMGKWQING